MKFRKFFSTLLILNTVFTTVLNAQATDEEYWKGWYETPLDVAGIGDWDKAAWWTASGVLVTGVVLYTQDQRIYESFADFRTPSSDAVSKYILEPFGSGVYSMGGTAIAFGVGSINGDDRLQRTSAQAFKAYILTAGATQILKQITHRPRPDEIPSSGLWYGPTGISGRYDAFPSGHTSSAFAVASVFAHSYKEHPWVGITLYSIAGLTGLSRIHDGRHWASDAFFGAAMGWYVGKVIVENDSRLSVFPGMDGVYLSWSLDP